jgi:hypothetical protein
MSAPARELAPAPEWRRPARPDAAPTARPTGSPAPVPAHGPRPTRARRKKHHLGFALLASVVVGGIVFGIVIVNVLLAQQSFVLDEAERRLQELSVERLELVRERATLSAPGRIAEWASRHGMRLPDDIRILRAPNGPADPAGADTTEADTSTGAEG